MRKYFESINRKTLFVTLLISAFILTTSVAYAALTLSSTAVSSDGALTLTGNANSTLDLGASNTLSLQTTNNGPITTGSGLFTLGGNLTIAGLASAGTQCLRISSTGVVSGTGSDCGSGGSNYFTNSGLNTYLNTGTNLQAATFNATSTIGTSTFSGSLDVTNSVITNNLTIGSGATGFELASDPTRVPTAPVATFRATANNSATVVDIMPNGTNTPSSITNELGTGPAWLDIVNRDLKSVSDPGNWQVARMAIGDNGNVTMGSVAWGTKTTGTVIIQGAGLSFVRTGAGGVALDSPLLITNNGIYPAKHIIYLADNTYDIGASGTSRPRSLYVGTNGIFGGIVGIGTSSPNANAILDLTSTTKAFLLPRMTKVQRDAIASPTAGMAVYQTDNTPGLRVYNGTNWMRYTETAD